MADYSSIISALAALSGVALSQWWSSRHAQKTREYNRKVLLREKYEELMFHFSESLEYLVHLNGSKTEESVLSLAQCPSARKALNLCLLYFHELTPAANDYVRALYTYYAFVLKYYDKNNTNTAGGQANLKSPDYNNTLKNIQSKKDEFEHLIMKYVPKYTYT